MCCVNSRIFDFHGLLGTCKDCSPKGYCSLLLEIIARDSRLPATLFFAINIVAMLSIRLSEVPAFLRRSDFFDSMDKECENPVSIPEDCFKTDTLLEHDADLQHMLSTLRFLGARTLPTELVLFAIRLSDAQFQTSIAEFRQSWPSLSFISALRAGIANCSGVIAPTDYSTQCFRNWDADIDVVQSVVKLCFFQYAVDDGTLWNVHTCILAAKFGAFKVLQFLHEHGCPWNASTCESAAAAGRVDILQYAHAMDCPWDCHTCAAAATHNSLACLRYAHENGCPWDDRSCLITSIRCFEYARAHGCPSSAMVCRDAAAQSDLSKLQLAHLSGLPWDETSCEWAARMGRLECLQYAYDSGCCWDRAQMCGFAASSLPCLEFLYSKGCVLNAHTCIRAAAMASLICLRFAHMRRGEWDKRTCEQAAVRGALNCLITHTKTTVRGTL